MPIISYSDFEWQESQTRHNDHVDVSHAPVQHGSHTKAWIKIEDKYGHDSENSGVNDLK